MGWLWWHYKCSKLQQYILRTLGLLQIYAKWRSNRIWLWKKIKVYKHKCMFTFVFSFTGQNRLTTETQLFIGSCLAQLNFYILVLDFTFITTPRTFVFQGKDLRSSEWVNKHNFMKAFLSRSRTHRSQETWNSRSSSGLTNLNNMKKLQTSSTLSWFTFQAIKD